MSMNRVGARLNNQISLRRLQHRTILYAGITALRKRPAAAKARWRKSNATSISSRTHHQSSVDIARASDSEDGARMSDIYNDQLISDPE